MKNLHPLRRRQRLVGLLIIAEMDPFRQGEHLAEGQKGADVKDNLTLPTSLRPPIEMAQGGLAPEENAGFWSLEDII